MWHFDKSRILLEAQNTFIYYQMLNCIQRAKAQGQSIWLLHISPQLQPLVSPGERPLAETQERCYQEDKIDLHRVTLQSFFAPVPGSIKPGSNFWSYIVIRV